MELQKSDVELCHGDSISYGTICIGCEKDCEQTDEIVISCMEKRRRLNISVEPCNMKCYKPWLHGCPRDEKISEDIDHVKWYNTDCQYYRI